LTFVLGFLKPAVKHGLIEFWVDRHMRGRRNLGRGNRQETA
jgi:hypothetical protein